MKRNLTLFIVTLLLLSCKNKNKEKIREIAKKNIQVTTTNYFSISSDIIPITLKIPTPKKGEISPEKIIQKIDFIPLETKGKNSQIGEITKIINYKNLYFILDNSITNKVFVFNSKGMFICNIGKKGKGKGEYISLTDITINKENENIILFDYKQNKFLFFNFKGTFLKELIFNDFEMDGVNNVQHYKNDLYIISSNNSTNSLENPEMAYNLKLFDIKKRVTVSRHFKEGKIKSILPYETSNIYSPYKGGYNYSASWESKIYHIKENQLNLSYNIDFGSEGIPKDLYDRHSRGKNLSNPDEKSKVIETITDAINKENYSFLPHVFLESDSHIFLQYVKNERNLFVFYDKKSENIVGSSTGSTKGYTLNYLPYISFPIAINEAQEFIGCFIPFQMYELYDYQKGSMSDEKEIKRLKKEHPKFYEIFSKLDKNDNPVIAIWKFKNF